MSNMKNWLQLMESVAPNEEGVDESALSTPISKAMKSGGTRSLPGLPVRPKPANEGTCSVCNESPCCCEAPNEETLTFEDWSVIYDSVNAKNVKASVRMKSKMDEAEVREWFQRVFSPMGIHEMNRAAKQEDQMDEAQLDEFGLNDLAKPGQTTSSVAKPSVQITPNKPTVAVTVGKDKFGFKDNADANEFATKVKAGEISVDEDDRQEQGMYKDLSDAYEPGPTEVWYWKDDMGRDMMMGKNWLIKYNKMPDPANLAATHVKIGSVKETNPEKVYHMMQGEIWSPEGQSRNFIKSSGTGHTSMSMGDILVINGQAQMVDRFGFSSLDAEPTDESNVMEGRCHLPAGGARALMEAHEVKLMVNDDHEVRMAQAELYRLAKDAIALHNLLDQMANLEGWVSAKITLATDYVATVRDYVDDFARTDGESQEDQLPAVVPGEEPMEVPMDTPEVEMEARHDDFDDEEDEAPPEDPDSDKIQHIVMQLKKAYDVGGNYPITFKDGTKHKLDMRTITAFLEKYLSLKPFEREEMQARAGAGLLDFQATMESMDEAVTINEKPIDSLAKIVADKQASKVKFVDGSSIMVDLFSASALMGVYRNLSKEETKTKFQNMTSNKAGFLKLLDFALSKNN